jgi:hypothetical protein
MVVLWIDVGGVVDTLRDNTVVPQRCLSRRRLLAVCIMQ